MAKTSRTRSELRRVQSVSRVVGRTCREKKHSGLTADIEAALAIPQPHICASALLVRFPLHSPLCTASRLAPPCLAGAACHQKPRAEPEREEHESSGGECAAQGAAAAAATAVVGLLVLGGALLFSGLLCSAALLVAAAICRESNAGFFQSCCGASLDPLLAQPLPLHRSPPTPPQRLEQEKVTLLERLDFEDVQESEIKKHHTRYRMVETY